MNKVAVILGSESDRAVADKAVKVLDEHTIPYEVSVISAHRNPEELDRYLRESDDVSVIIAIAGLSAALPGIIASKTEKPVIGVCEWKVVRRGRFAFHGANAFGCSGGCGGYR